MSLHERAAIVLNSSHSLANLPVLYLLLAVEDISCVETESPLFRVFSPGAQQGNTNLAAFECPDMEPPCGASPCCTNKSEELLGE